jgi:hypothetical protein
MMLHCSGAGGATEPSTKSERRRSLRGKQVEKTVDPLPAEENPTTKAKKSTTAAQRQALQTLSNGAKPGNKRTAKDSSVGEKKERRSC